MKAWLYGLRQRLCERFGGHEWVMDGVFAVGVGEECKRCKRYLLYIDERYLQERDV